MPFGREIRKSAPEKRHGIMAAILVYRPAVEALKKLRRGGRPVINPTRREEFELRAMIIVSARIIGATSVAVGGAGCATEVAPTGGHKLCWMAERMIKARLREAKRALAE